MRKCGDPFSHYQNLDSTLVGAGVTLLRYFGGAKVRTVGEYLLKAFEFEALAKTAPEDALKKRYADLAACYRMLAEERKQLIESDTGPPAPPRK
jgi:hypothetical protein